MPGGVFVSYRRGDAAHAAGRLVERLGQVFRRDQLFLDIDAIEPGIDFVKTISENVQSCEVLIAVIGPNWLDARDENGIRRLDDPKDFVVLEIEAALLRDIRVIPVLVDGAAMPSEWSLPPPLKPLANRNAVRLAHDRFSSDADALIRSLAKIVRPANPAFLPAPAPIDPSSNQDRKTFIPRGMRADLTLVTAAALSALTSLFMLSLNDLLPGFRIHFSDHSYWNRLAYEIVGIVCVLLLMIIWIGLRWRRGITYELLAAFWLATVVAMLRVTEVIASYDWVYEEPWNAATAGAGLMLGALLMSVAAGYWVFRKRCELSGAALLVFVGGCIALCGGVLYQINSFITTRYIWQVEYDWLENAMSAVSTLVVLAGILIVAWLRVWWTRQTSGIGSVQTTIDG